MSGSVLPVTAEVTPSRADVAGARIATILEGLSPLIAGGVALALGALLLGQKPLTANEAATVASSSETLPDAFRSVLHEEPGALLTTLLFRPLAAVTTNAWLVRIPSVAAFVAAALLAYIVGRRLHGRLAGVVSGLVVATAAPGVVAAQRVGPAALSLAAVLAATWLLLRALDGGTPGRWAEYAGLATLLPLLHPACIGVLVAHAATTALRTSRDHRRLPLLAFAIPALVSLVLGASVAADRWSDASGGSVGELIDGPWTALAWNVALAALAVVGLVATARGRGTEPARWKVTLDGALIVAPLAIALLAGALVPVQAETTGTIALAGVALAAGAGVAALPRPELVAYATAALAGLAIAGLAWWYLATPAEDWRGAARAVQHGRAPDTVVVVPDRASSALERELGGTQPRLRAGGDVVAVVVLGDPDRAADAARSAVPTPRYALLEQRRVSDRIVVQRWVRP